MHEYSIVMALVELCEKEAKQRGAINISKVTISIGERNGVDRAILGYSFDLFKEESDILKHAMLEINTIDGHEMFLQHLEIT